MQINLLLPDTDQTKQAWFEGIKEGWLSSGGTDNPTTGSRAKVGTPVVQDASGHPYYYYHAHVEVIRVLPNYKYICVVDYPDTYPTICTDVNGRILVLNADNLSAPQPAPENNTDPTGAR